MKCQPTSLVMTAVRQKENATGNGLPFLYMNLVGRCIHKGVGRETVRGEGIKKGEGKEEREEGWESGWEWGRKWDRKERRGVSERDREGGREEEITVDKKMILIQATVFN